MFWWDLKKSQITSNCIPYLEKKNPKSNQNIVELIFDIEMYLNFCHK